MGGDRGIHTGLRTDRARAARARVRKLRERTQWGAWVVFGLRRVSGQQLIQNHTERIDVGRSRNRFAANLFRTGVLGGHGIETDGGC